MSLEIKSFFHKDSATFTYVVFDLDKKNCLIIDPALDYDHFSGRITTESVNEILNFIKINNLNLEYILETHIHADHITAANYIKSKIQCKIAIGSKISKVIEYWSKIFDYKDEVLEDNFDLLLEDNSEIKFGDNVIKVIHTPGHTPACVSYIIQDNIFTGDTIFMPDIGTARTDFPGGDASSIYQSIKKILSYDDSMKIYVGHDYPPENKREIRSMVTVGEQNLSNIMINKNVTIENFIESRNNKDKGKAVPRLLFPSIQLNLRSGKINNQEFNNISYIKIPINII